MIYLEKSRPIINKVWFKYRDTYPSIPSITNPHEINLNGLDLTAKHFLKIYSHVGDKLVELGNMIVYRLDASYLEIMESSGCQQSYISNCFLSNHVCVSTIYNNKSPAL